MNNNITKYNKNIKGEKDGKHNGIKYALWNVQKHQANQIHIVSECRATSPVWITTNTNFFYDIK